MLIYNLYYIVEIYNSEIDLIKMNLKWLVYSNMAKDHIILCH